MPVIFLLKLWLVENLNLELCETVDRLYSSYDSYFGVISISNPSFVKSSELFYTMNPPDPYGKIC